MATLESLYLLLSMMKFQVVILLCQIYFYHILKSCKWWFFPQIKINLATKLYIGNSIFYQINVTYNVKFSIKKLQAQL